MSLADRGMNRREFRKLINTALRCTRIDIPGFKGTAGILDIFDTDGAWKVRSNDAEVTIAAPGYKWLQLAPDHGKWWLTVMYDTEGRLIQYYFDITKRHYASASGELRFEDLFLDIVMMPDGSFEIMDRSELCDAFRNGVVSEFDYRRALSILYELSASLRNKEHQWRDLCSKAMEIVNKNSRG